MKKLLVGYALLGIALAGCAGTHRLPPTVAKPPLTVQRDSAQLVGFEATPDSLPFVLVTPRPTLLDQLLHRTPATVATRALPAKIKNSTVSVTYNQVAGNQTNHTTSTTTAKNGRTVVGDGASNTEAGKKAGPLTQAAAGADVHVASSRKGPAQAGDGNRATEQSGGWPWWLWLLIVAGVLYAISRIYKRFTPA